MTDGKVQGIEKAIAGRCLYLSLLIHKADQPAPELCRTEQYLGSQVKPKNKATLLVSSCLVIMEIQIC